MIFEIILGIIGLIVLFFVLKFILKLALTILGVTIGVPLYIAISCVMMMFHHLIPTVVMAGIWLAVSYFDMSNIFLISASIFYIAIIVHLENREAARDVSNALQAALDELKIIPVEKINTYKPKWSSMGHNIRERLSSADAPRQLAEAWVAAGKLQKKELWDKREYYYQSDSLIISIYREIEQKVTDFFDTIFDSKGIYVEGVPINLFETDTTCYQLKNMCKDVLVEKYLNRNVMDEKLCCDTISHEGKPIKIFMNLPVVKKKMELLEKDSLLNTGKILKKSDGVPEDILQDIMTTIHKFLPDFDYVRISDKDKFKKTFMNLSSVKKKIELLKKDSIFDISQLFATDFPKDILQDIMTTIHANLPDCDYVMFTESHGKLWIHRTYASQYKCEICGGVFKETKLYGPKRYCASCLNKRHSQEAADEAEGKTVKRYVDAPPPGMIIK